MTVRSALREMADDETVDLTSVEVWEAVFGQAQRQQESSSGGVDGEFLPFLFSLVAKDASHLRVCISDFHSQTWQEDVSVQQLQELREDVGIGNDLDEFLAYLRSAFSSNNVRVFLGGQDRSASGMISAQKIRGTPFVSLPLRRLEGSAADTAKASIAFSNFRAFLALSSSITSEKAQAGGLIASLAAEKAKSERLQEQIDASSFRSRSKLNKAHPSLSASQQPSLLLTQLDNQVVLPSLPIVPGTVKDDKKVAVPKAPGHNSRAHVAPTSRRVKQRGTVIRESTDE